MNKKYYFKNLDAYKESKNLVKIVYGLLSQFPKEEQYALCDQLRRAVISVPSNVAEGLGRYSAKEQVHFIEIAHGSLREVDCQLEIAYDLGYISVPDIQDVQNLIARLGALLSGVHSWRIEENPLNAKR